MVTKGAKRVDVEPYRSTRKKPGRFSLKSFVLGGVIGAAIGGGLQFGRPVATKEEKLPAIVEVASSSPASIPVQTTSNIESRKSIAGDVSKAFEKTLSKVKGKITGDVSFAVYDLDNDEYLVKHNENQPVVAASLIKPFWALAAYHNKAAKSPFQSGIEANVREAIVVSDNRAANALLKTAGGAAQAQKTLREYGFDGISVTESIPGNDRVTGNTLTAVDAIKFLGMIHTSHVTYSGKGAAVAPAFLSRISHAMGAYNTSNLHDGLPGVVDLRGKTGHISGIDGEMLHVTYSKQDGSLGHYALFVAVHDTAESRKATADWSLAKTTANKDALRKLVLGVHEEILRH